MIEICRLHQTAEQRCRKPSSRSRPGGGDVTGEIVDSKCYLADESAGKFIATVRRAA